MINSYRSYIRKRWKQSSRQGKVLSVGMQGKVLSVAIDNADDKATKVGILYYRGFLKHCTFYVHNNMYKRLLTVCNLKGQQELNRTYHFLIYCLSKIRPPKNMFDTATDSSSEVATRYHTASQESVKT